MGLSTGSSVTQPRALTGQLPPSYFASGPGGGFWQQTLDTVSQKLKSTSEWWFPVKILADKIQNMHFLLASCAYVTMTFPSLSLPSWGVFWPATEKLLGANVALYSLALSMSVCHRNYIILVNFNYISQQVLEDSHPLRLITGYFLINYDHSGPDAALT